MELIFVGLIAFLTILFIVSAIRNTRKESAREREEYLEELDKTIAFKMTQLNELTEQLETRRMDNKVSLPKAVNEVLDIYEESNIRIPADIIEDAAIMEFDDRKEIFDYIENQRHYWKMENSKKPYRRVK